MAKKKAKSGVNFIYMIITLVAGTLTYVSMAFNFIGKDTTGGVLGNTATSTSVMSLGDWFKYISTLSDIDRIASWQIAKAFFIITLVLVGLVLICLVINAFIKNKALGNCIKIVAILAAVSALVFFITVITGSSALSSSAGDTSLIGASNRYYPSVAPYLVTIFTLSTTAFTFLALRKSK